MILRFRATSILSLTCCVPSLFVPMILRRRPSRKHSHPKCAPSAAAWRKGHHHFGEVTPHLYRGGLLRGDGLKALKRLGINIVVDTHANDTSEERDARSLGMKYVAIPWHCPWPKDEVFAKFLKVLHENKGKKVFVHCRLGDDRTGMMVAAYRMPKRAGLRRRL